MKKPLGERIFGVFNVICMLFLIFICVYPFWYVICVAFNDSNLISYHRVYFWPLAFTLKNFQVMFQNVALLQGFVVTILRTVIGTALSLTLTGLVAYALSKKQLIGRKFYLGAVTLTMFFSGGLIPTFLLMKDLHLLDSFWVLIVPVLLSAWNILIMKSFFQGLPDSLEESAKIDGANDIRVFFSIVVPVSVPMIMTMLLFIAIYHWNDWAMGEIYLTTNQGMLPVQTILMRMITQMNLSASVQGLNSDALNKAPSLESVKMATIVITTLPIMVIYPFLQKYFVKGIMLGAIKE